MDEVFFYKTFDFAWRSVFLRSFLTVALRVPIPSHPCYDWIHPTYLH